MPPPELWYKIIEYIPSPSMEQLVRFAQVNREFRRVFLSDTAWAKFNVYDVRDQTTIYSYGDYKLSGVAAHFFNYLSGLPSSEQAAFFQRHRGHGEYVSSSDLYSQINTLSLIWPLHELNSACLQLIQLSVWRLWSSTHLVEKLKCADGGGLFPSWALNDEQVCFFLAKLGLLGFTPFVFRFDWDINLAVFTCFQAGGKVEILPRFLQNKQFVLSALWELQDINHIWREERALQLAEFWSSDWDVVAGACKVLENPSFAIQSDRDSVLRAVQDSSVLKYASENLRRDREIVLAAVNYNGSSLQHATPNLRNDHEMVLAAVKCWSAALEYASEDLRNDRKVVLAAVKRGGYALEYASENLRNDREIVTAAVADCGYALEHASEKLRNDREYVMMVVKRCGHYLRYAPQGLRNDREVVLAAVKDWSAALKYASSDLRNDREIVLVAVKRDGGALKYASENLRNDREVVTAAVAEYGYALEHAFEDLRSDRKIVMGALHNTKHSVGVGAFVRASEELRHDREVVLAAVKNWGALEFVPKDLRSDREIVLAAISCSGYALAHASEDLRNDREVVLAAVQKDRGALQYASEYFRNCTRLRYERKWQNSCVHTKLS